MRLTNVHCLRVLLTTIAFFLLITGSNAQKFVGDLLFKALPDGRNMELLAEFAFQDSEGKIWTVPEGWVVDGASIPTPLWSILGAPFSGKYRSASVIHDYFCDARTKPWKDVHRVFYDAMLAGGVDELKAKLMYLAVYRFGPRWDYQPECPANMACDGRPPYVTEFKPRFNQRDLDAIERILNRKPSISLKDLEIRLDAWFLEDVGNNNRSQQ